MTLGIKIRRIAAAVGISALLSIVVVVGQAQVAPPLSEVKATVLDQNGAVMPDCEIVFKSVSETIVLHTGADGSATVKLRSGRYSVTTSTHAFLKNQILDFQIVAPVPDELRIVLKIDPDFCSRGGCTCSGPTCNGDPMVVPTTTSDLPLIIESEPSRVPPPSPATRTSRSWQCLYLWKCSTQ